MQYHSYPLSHLLYCLIFTLLPPAPLATSTGAQTTPATYRKVAGISKEIFIRRDERGVAPLPQSTGGSGRTINAGTAVAMRFVVDTGDWDSARQGLALGESGDPSNPRWVDQLADWRKVSERAFPFSKQGVAKSARRSHVLVPITAGAPIKSAAPTL
jgi:hypothetical protein